jgi:hypothetical protein
MASPPTSARIRFIDGAGSALAAPLEWTPALVELLVDPTDWDAAELTVQGEPVPVSLRRVGDTIRVVAEWPRSGPGYYRLTLVTDDASEDLVVTIEPRKIDSAAFRCLLADLETRLPVTIALGLQRAGGLTGISLPPPGQTTLAQELDRLRRAVRGVPGHRPGLVQVLESLTVDPHQMLRGSEFWARQDRARRPHPARLAQAAGRPNNWEAGLPRQVVDSRVDPTTDVYENRLVAAFTTEVLMRLRRLTRVFRELQSHVQADEAASLQGSVERARRAATFLNDVSPPAFLPTRTTMVLLKRPPYCAALTGYLELHRSVAVRLEDPVLASPLENLPRLYQVWGTLQVIAALLDVAPDLGYIVSSERLTGRDLAGIFVRILPDGQPALTLARADGCSIRLVPEPTYGRAGPLYSISFFQRPDIAVEVIHPDGQRRVVVFDPKYKLDGESAAEGIGHGRPQKSDIDKMHAYRDAIRDHALRRVVTYAAILYPGPETIYADGIEALTAYPGRDSGLERRLRHVLTAALAELRDGSTVIQERSNANRTAELT